MAVQRFCGTGRRKSSVARVGIVAGEGSILVNGKDYKKYFSTDSMRLAVELPLNLLDKKADFDITVNVRGGGLSGQADAAKLGISRAMLASDENLRKSLREHGLLTVDARIKERKKPGQKGARAKFQFVKR